MSDEAQIQEAIRRFDQENAQDPNTVVINGAAHPHELFYAQKLTEWVRRLFPEPSLAVLLAARSQHLCRWKIPRNSYELTRGGYLRWRSDLKLFHAERSAEILRELGYPAELITRVQELNLKKNLGKDPECQLLEDALCLVTLEYQLEALIEKNPPEKMVEILRKTWKKMSPAAHEHALTLPFSERARELIQQALS